MTLEEFLNQTVVRNAWVRHPDFAGLYVRQGPFIYFPRNGLRDAVRRVDDSIQIGNISAKYPGNGAFTQLLAWIRQNYPDRLLYIESVQEDRFADFLLKNGFKETTLPACFVLDSVRVEAK